MNHFVQQIKAQCEQYLNQPVQVQVHGQSEYSGIIEHVDDNYVYLMVPVDEHGNHLDLSMMAGAMSRGPDERYPYYRQFYPFNPYYNPYFYPQPFGWNRLILPLVALTALATIF